LEDATKVSQALLQSGKEYVCVTRLHKSIPEGKVRSVLDEFQGEIYQRPPIRSSVKRRLRTRTIYYLNFLEMQENNVLFKVGCQSGTYIRKLCFDIGEVLGCGAHMRELRRTRAGPFTEDDGLVTLYDVLKAVNKWRETGEEKYMRSIIFPMEKAFELLPKIVIRDSAVSAICHGASVTAPGILSLEEEICRGDLIAVFTQKGEAVALAQAVVSSDTMLTSKRGFMVEPTRILMERDTYPKMWGASSIRTSD
jgi:H/ACA ribonucleoprotein complex subunit 4